MRTHSFTPNEVRVESHKGMEDELNDIGEKWKGLDEEEDAVIETSDQGRKFSQFRSLRSLITNYRFSSAKLESEYKFKID